MVDVAALQRAALQRAAREVFADTPVRFAYLFGSQASGRPRPDSDVDVAVWLDPDTPPGERWELSLRLPELLERASDVGPIEAIVILNDAPLVLAGRVLRNCAVIYGIEEPARVRYETRTRSEALDFDLVLERLNEELLRATAEGKR
jgi:predicted nucleotidyltransferase